MNKATNPSSRVFSIAEHKEKIKQAYTKQIAAAYVKEIVTSLYNLHSWQLHSCFLQYHSKNRVPTAVLASVSSFCLKMDMDYPLTVDTITATFAEQRLSSLQYTSAVRREVEKKKAYIIEQLQHIEVL